MKKATNRTAKKTRRAVTAILCLSVALTGGAAMGLAGYTMSQREAYSYTAYAEGETQSAYGGLDLTANIKNTTGEPNVDSASNTLIFTFPNENMEAGSKMEENSIGDASWKDFVLLHSTVEETQSTLTVNEWIAKGKSFRFAVYGKCFILQFENNSFGGGAEIDRVHFKAGFKLFQGGTANSDWVFSKKCDVAVDTTVFTKDLAIYVNRTAKKYEYYAKSLTVTGVATKTSYAAGESFDPTGLSLSVVTLSDETVSIPVTADMCTYDFSATGEKQVTIAYGGGTATYTVTVEAPAKTATAVTANFELTSQKYALPSEITVPDGAKITVTYDDNSTEEKDFALTMLKGAFNGSTPVAGVIDTSTAGEKQVAVSYSEGAATVEGTVKLTVSDEAKASNIMGVDYSKGADGAGGLGVDFNYTPHGSDGMKALDNIKNLPSLIPGKELGHLVEIKFSKKPDLIKMRNKKLVENGANFQPSFYGGRLVFRNAQTLNSTYGEIEYVIIRAGFIWYSSSGEDTWGQQGDADTNNYFPVASNYVTQDLYIGYSGGKLVKPIESLTVNVAEGKTIKLAPEQTLTDADLAGVTYSATYLDPAETVPLTGNVTAAMCSKAPTEVGAGEITVTLLGKTATFPVTVVAPGKTVESVTADFTLTANKFALPLQITIPDGAKITVTYSDDTTEQKDFTLEMLGVAGNAAGVIDTSTAGDKELTFTYSEGGVDTTGTVTLTVNDTAQKTALLGVEYGGDGAFSGNRKLPFKTAGTLNTKITYGQENCASLIPGQKMSDLILVKFANEAEPRKYSSLSKNGHFYALGSTWFLAIESSDTDQYGKVEYVCLKAGLLLYSSSGDCGDVNAYASYFPLQNLDGDCAYLANDVYLTWTKQTVGENFGTVVKPVKNLAVTVEDGKTLEFAPEQILRNEDLAGVTYTAEWVDPNETSAAPSGNVTANMCSPVSSTAGPGTVTVSLNGMTATFDVTVLEASMPKEIAVVAKDDTQDFSIIYKKYAVVPDFINCQLMVTYEDDTTEAFELRPEMITKRINTRSDNTTSGDIIIEFTRYGKTLTTTFTATVDQSQTVNSTIESVAYGKTVDGYRVEFNWKDGGDQGLKALDAVHLLPSSAPKKFNGQFIEIKFSKKDAPIALLNDKNEYTEEALSKLQPAFYAGVFVLREANKLEEEYGTIEYIVIRQGFVWYTSDRDNWGVGNDTDTSGYYPVARNITTKKMYAAWADGKLIRPVASIEAECAEGFKKNYYNGEELSLDFTLKVTYVDGGEEVVTPTRAMCGAIENGKAIVTYASKTCEITGLTYDDTKKVGGITIETNGKTQYSFAAEEFDLSDYVVKMILLNVADNTEAERVTLNARDIEFDGFDSHALGKQTVKLMYAGQETTVEVEVVNDAPEKHMTIDYISNYDSFETTLLNGLSIHFGFTPEVGKVTSESFLYAADLPNVADKMLINGKLASEWKKEGVIEYIGFYGQQIYIRLVGDKLQGSKNPTGGFGQYVEGKTELVETVTFLPGFQYYSVKKNIWPGEWTMNDVTLVKHGVVKEQITLVNVDAGHGWVRQFKQNADKTGLADDAITVNKLPAKTKFTVGEEVTVDTLLNGLELLFKYEDGGSETYVPTMSDIEFEKDVTATEGKKTVSVYFKYNDYYTTFEIEVEKEKKGGCAGGCNSEVSASAAIVGGVLALGASVAALNIAKRKHSEIESEEGDNK